MKKRKNKVMLILLGALMLCCIVALPVFAGETVYAAEPEWTAVSGTTVTYINQQSAWRAETAADTVGGITYNQAVNAETGSNINYMLMDKYFAASPDARTQNNNYVSVRIINAQGIGVELKTFYQYSDSGINSFQTAAVTDLYYIDPSMTAGDADSGDFAGYRYVESIETYKGSFAYKHHVQVRKEGGRYYVSFDGRMFKPMNEYADMDLSTCNVSISFKSTAATTRIFADKTDANVKSFISQGEWATSGDTVMTQNADGTVSYEMKDERTIAYNGQTPDTGCIRVREDLVNVKGYDVNKEINVSFSYNVHNAPTVWWGMALAKEPFGSENKLKFDDAGNRSKYSSKVLDNNYGVMFRLVDSTADTAWEEEERLVGFSSNNNLTGYTDISELDTVKYIIGETSTAMYFNNKKLYDLPIKKSDYADGKAYPTFHFIETPASALKFNRITVNGVNSPAFESKLTNKFYSGGDDLQIGLNNHEDKVLEVFDGNLSTPVPSESYSFENSKLIIDSEYLSQKAFGLYDFYVKNSGGVAKCVIQVADINSYTEPPVIYDETGANKISQVYWLYMYGEQDLVFKVDLKQGVFSRFIGAQIPISGYTWQNPVAPSTIGTLTLKKSFLNDKDIGVYKMTFETKNIDQEAFSSSFQLEVVSQVPKGVKQIAVTNTASEVPKGCEIDLSKLTMTATYEDNQTETVAVTDAMLSGYDKNTTGKQTVTVTYQNRIAEFEITVVDKALVSLSVQTVPDNYRPAKGEVLDLSKIILTGTFEGGLTGRIALTQEMISGYDANNTGEQTITITYADKTATLVLSKQKGGCGCGGSNGEAAVWLVVLAAGLAVIRKRF